MDAVDAVVPGCAVPGSSGGWHLRLAVNVEIAVWVIVLEQREKGRRFLRAPLTHRGVRASVFRQVISRRWDVGWVGRNEGFLLDFFLMGVVIRVFRQVVIRGKYDSCWVLSRGYCLVGLRVDSCLSV